jgi:hypothetical protein
MIVSSSKCKSIAVYGLFGLCIPTSVPFLCDRRDLAEVQRVVYGVSGGVIRIGTV